jgi:hypothetical protein
VPPGPTARFLTIRHPPFNPHFYDELLEWTRNNLPDVFPRFDLRTLPCSVPEDVEVALHIPWLQDPVQNWSLEVYEQADALAAECDARKIPIINRVDRLLNTTKFLGASLIAGPDLRTPRMKKLAEPRDLAEAAAELGLPLLVREDWGHGGTLVVARTGADLRRVPLAGFSRPVAVEFVDVADPRDGLYRKYRYIAAGDEGVSHHLQISQDWQTRGFNRVKADAARDEEIAYTNAPDRNHAAFQRARRALGLDLVAFDYSYDREGRTIVWEANPYPHLTFSRTKYMHKNPPMHRTHYAIMQLYLQRAGLPIPAKIQDRLARIRKQPIGVPSDVTTPAGPERSIASAP